MKRLAAVLILVGAGMALPASASGAVVTCAQLQDAFNNAQPNETVTLAAGQMCQGTYALPEDTPIIFEGQSGAGFQPGGETTGRSLFGDRPEATIIRNLTFRGPADGRMNAGGLETTGNAALTIDNCTFTGIEWDADGGAVYLNVYGTTGRTTVRNSTFGQAGNGNVAHGSGGGLTIFSTDAVTLENNSFTDNRAGLSGGGARISARSALIKDNVFDANEAGQAGGGLALTTEASADEQVLRRIASADADLEGNTFTRNTAGAGYILTRDVPPAETNWEGTGGGLFAGKAGDGIDGPVSNGTRFAGPYPAGGAPPAINLIGNRYDSNDVDDTINSTRGRSGGGAFLYGVRAYSERERYTRNEVHGSSQDCECAVEGGGLSVSGTSFQAVRAATLEAVNLVVAGNRVGDFGEGAGIYIGASEGSTTLNLDHATVAGNETGVFGSGPGIAADSSDQISILRSIVYGNTVEPSQAGRATTRADIEGTYNISVDYSDVCDIPLERGGRAPAPGQGNICEDPRLVGPAAAQGADVHQTAASPTIDRIPNLEGNVEVDYEGEQRPIIASSRTSSPWDMGADEFTTADYRVAVTGTPATVTEGDQVTYKVTVTNAGPAEVAGLNSSLALPAGAQLVSVSQARACQSGTTSCTVDRLAPGASSVITIVARLTAVGDNTATATVTGPPVDPTPADHTATATTRVNARPTATPPQGGGALPAVQRPRCGSRRRFRIRVRYFPRDPVVRAVIRVNGKRVKVRRAGKYLVAVVDMRKLRRGRYHVTIRGVTASGKRVSGRRTYHTCRGKGPHTVPDL